MNKYNTKMKKSLIYICLSLLSLQGFSQDKINKFSVDPIKLIGFNMTNFEFERGFLDGKLGVSFYFGRTAGATRNIGDYTRYIVEQNVSIKGYLKTIGMNSFWYGGEVLVSSGSVSHNENNKIGARNLGTLGFTTKMGYQFIIKSFYLDFYGGIGYALTNNLYGNVEYRGGYEEPQLLVVFGLKTGIAF